MSLKSLVFALLGAIIGYLWFESQGLVYFAFSGYLLGVALDLKTRLTKHEEHLKRFERWITGKLEERTVVVDSSEQPEAPDEVALDETAPQDTPISNSLEEDISEELEFHLVPEKEAAPDEASPHIPAGEDKQRLKTLTYIRDFFTKGNLVVRVGLIILFFGVAFLLKYVAEHSKLPIEVRFICVALGALAMLVIGWKMRVRNRTFALLIQGGAIGIMYITVFAAGRLYGLVPLGFAFGVMVALVFLSGML
ncbi:MAG: DUF2339 domain-containing protein, partial [Candidatus Mariimomonas ferrooxydans]